MDKLKNVAIREDLKKNIEESIKKIEEVSSCKISFNTYLARMFNRFHRVFEEQEIKNWSEK